MPDCDPEGRKEKIHPSGSQAVMPDSDPGDGFFCLSLTPMIDSNVFKCIWPSGIELQGTHYSS